MNVDFHTERRNEDPAPSTLKTLGFRSPSSSEVNNQRPKEDFSSAIGELMKLRERAISSAIANRQQQTGSIQDVALMPEGIEDLNEEMSLNFNLSSSIDAMDTPPRLGDRLRSARAVGPIQPMQAPEATPLPVDKDAGLDDFDEDGMALLADSGGPNFPDDDQDDGRNQGGGDNWKDDKDEEPFEPEGRFLLEPEEPKLEVKPPETKPVTVSHPSIAATVTTHVRDPWQKVSQNPRAEEVKEIFESETPFNLIGVDDAAWPSISEKLQPVAAVPAMILSSDPRPITEPKVSVSVSRTPAPTPEAHVFEQPVRKQAPVLFSLSKPKPVEPGAAAPALPVAGITSPPPAVPAIAQSEPPASVEPEKAPELPAAQEQPQAAMPFNAEDAAQSVNLSTRPSMTGGIGTMLDENSPKSFTEIGPRSEEEESTASIKFPSFARNAAAPSPWPGAPTPVRDETPEVKSEVPETKETPVEPDPEPTAVNEDFPKSSMWTPSVESFAPPTPDEEPASRVSFSTAMPDDNGWSRKVSSNTESEEVQSTLPTEIVPLAHPADELKQEIAPKDPIPSAKEFSEQVVSVPCPACQDELKVLRSNLGVSGSCVSCSHPLVAFETFAGSVSAIKLDPSQVASPDPSAPATFFIDRSTEVTAPSIAEEPANWTPAPEVIPEPEAAPAVPAPPIDLSSFGVPPLPATPSAPEPPAEPAESAEPVVEDMATIVNPWTNPAPPTNIPREPAPPEAPPAESISREDEDAMSFDSLRADQAEPVLAWLKQDPSAETEVTRPIFGAEAHTEAAKASLSSIFGSPTPQPESEVAADEPAAPEAIPPAPPIDQFAPTNEVDQAETVEPAAPAVEPPAIDKAQSETGFSPDLIDTPKKNTGTRMQLNLKQDPLATAATAVSENSAPTGMAAPAPFLSESMLPNSADATGEAVFGKGFLSEDPQIDDVPAPEPDLMNQEKSSSGGGAAVVLTLFVLAVFGTALAMFFIPGMNDLVGNVKTKIYDVMPGLAPEAPVVIPEAPVIKPEAAEDAPVIEEEKIPGVEDFDLGIFNGPPVSLDQPLPEQLSLNLPVPSTVVERLDIAALKGTPERNVFELEEE